jgi:hypothetical protein
MTKLTVINTNNRHIIKMVNCHKTYKNSHQLILSSFLLKYKDKNNNYSIKSIITKIHYKKHKNHYKNQYNKISNYLNE